jgi:sugar phosphate isomerase/epimerase
MKVGVQTRPWGPDANRNHLSTVLAEARSAGFDGIEIGAQHLDISKPAEFRQLLADHELGVAAIHVGGEIYDPKSVDEAMKNLEKSIHFAATVGAPCLAFSGKISPHKSDEEYQNESDSLNRIGAMCRENGLVLAYHNHFWEIEDDYRQMRYLLGHTDPSFVSLCLDLGWVKRGGGNPAAAVREFLPRIAYLHVKDTTADQWKELGGGDVDLPAIKDAIKGHHFDWCVNEQDETQGPAVESVTISRRYLSEHWGV